MCRRAILLVTLSVFAVGPMTLASVIPSARCVGLQRSARIAQMKNDTAEHARVLRIIAGECGDEINLLLWLDQFYRKDEQFAAEHKEVRTRLRDLLLAEETPISISLLERFIEEKETSPEDLELLGLVTRRWLEREPGSLALLEARTRIQVKLNDLAGARETLARLIKLDDKAHYRQNALALDYRLERWDDALEFLREKVASDPGNTTNRVGLVGVLARAGYFDELIEAVQPILDQPDAVEWILDPVLIPAAWSLYDAGRDEEAEAFFRLLREKAPHHPELGAVISHFYATDEELAAFRSAEQDKWTRIDDPTMLLKEGSTRLGAGDAASALPLIEKATRLDPDSAVAWFNLGLAALKLERWSEAEEALTRLIELDSSITDAFYNRGIARVELKRHKEAISDLTYYVGRRPTEKPPWYYLYICYTALGQTDKANEALRNYN